MQKFKVGDRIINNSSRGINYGKHGVCTHYNPDTTSRNSVNERCIYRFLYDDGSVGAGEAGSYKLENNKTIMSSIKSFIKSINRSEPDATFVKAGFMDENEELTTSGKEALEFVAWEANKKALKELADKVVADQEKK